MAHVGGLVDDWTEFEGFLLRSGCRLRELAIQVNDPDGGRLVNVLQLTPDLERLSITGSNLSEPFFSEMDAVALPRDTMEPAVDFLESLVSFRCATDQDSFDWSWLVSFLAIMTIRDKPSLVKFEFQHTGEHPSIFFNTVPDKDIFKLVMDVVQGLDVRILDSGRGLGRQNSSGS
ncbi:hypothetical protein CPB83DRAFT_834269 [Crepidotus variabilis]|uniref:Uncharacterized protein n=1 Tax=Crepidotus variabilis TaxID=179855 RepID=A0A9P6EKT2_9AGAR|nr:hypothetical protein CPB83DRAFT_834269 [Crepidotus variabilis]